MPIDIMKPIKKVCGAVMGKGGKVSPIVAETRLRICNQCPHLKFKKYVKMCGKCGCFVEEKVKFDGSNCDAGL